ncbi:E3 RID-alpha [simian adenovirus 1]|uniref:E3 RID-alpha n=1 Tax=simian adenovirus 1 TaxID=310540 RepID=Q5C8N9_9ADEN|nr:E3 RID-alpha [Simian adenovirus 1]AAX19418.1 E3 RID-alpha [Simian adenovirus 1]
MVAAFLLLLCLPIIFVSSTFAAVSHLEPECLPPFDVYLILTFVCCISICSIACFFITIFQAADYFYVRIAYFRHHPEYRNQNVASLLCLA